MKFSQADMVGRSFVSIRCQCGLGVEMRIIVVDDRHPTVKPFRQRGYPRLPRPRYLKPQDTECRGCNLSWRGMTLVGGDCVVVSSNVIRPASVTIEFSSEMSPADIQTLRDYFEIGEGRQ